MAWLRLSDVQIWPQVAHLPRPDTLKAIEADIGGLVTTLALSGPDLNGLELVTSMAKKWKAAGYDRIAMSSDDAKLFSGVLTSKVTAKNKKKKEKWRRAKQVVAGWPFLSLGRGDPLGWASNRCLIWTGLSDIFPSSSVMPM